MMLTLMLLTSMLLQSYFKFHVKMMLRYWPYQAKNRLNWMEIEALNQFLTDSYFNIMLHNL